MKDNPRPLAYLTLGIALVALSNVALIGATTSADNIVWGLVGIIGVLFLFIIAPLNVYYKYKKKKDTKEN